MDEYPRLLNSLNVGYHQSHDLGVDVLAVLQHHRLLEDDLG